MTEHKKVSFTSVSAGKSDKKKKKGNRTVRISLILPESNEKSCPEYNYGDLLSQYFSRKLSKKNSGEVINGPVLDPNDPLFVPDEDEALKALARQFEKKYANASTKRRKKDKNDLATLGEGYDETDPFIDNSDVLTDFVPTNMETKHGGFYINSGELDFTEVHEVEPDSQPHEVENDASNKKKRKNAISSDEESNQVEEGEEQENGLKKKQKLDEGELLRKRKKMIDMFNANKKKDGGELSDSKGESNHVEKVETNASTDKHIAASIEAVIFKVANDKDAAASAPLTDKTVVVENDEASSDSSRSDSNSSSDSSSSDSSSDEEEDSKPKIKENDKGDSGDEQNSAQENEANANSDTEDIPLPDNLPKDLVAVLQKLKEAGKTSKGSSQKFFTENVQKLLLSVEIKLYKCGGRKRTLIYRHLAQHLPCGAQTLLKRAKNLLKERLDNRLTEPMKKLKDAIEQAMAPLLERHAAECKKIAETNPDQYWEVYYHFWGEANAKAEEIDSDPYYLPQQYP